MKNWLIRVAQCHVLNSLTFIPKSTHVAAEDDFYDVYHELENIKARYFQLGIELRIPLGKLEAIRKTHSQDVEQALTQVLLLWLRQQYNVGKFGHPTWQRLREAVDSPAGGENHALAERIAKKYLTSSMSHHYNFCATLFLVIDLHLLHFLLLLLSPYHSLSPSSFLASISWIIIECISVRQQYVYVCTYALECNNYPQVHAQGVKKLIICYTLSLLAQKSSECDLEI